MAYSPEFYSASDGGEGGASLILAAVESTLSAPRGGDRGKNRN